MTKSPKELDLMAEAGRLLASVFSYLDQQPLAGLSTMRVNDMVDDYIVKELEARPASKGQYGYPYALNSSKNSVVCHGVPSHEDILRDGDIVNFDITLEKNGYLADSSKTYMVGNVSATAALLVKKTYEAMWKGIRAVRPGATLGEVGYAIESHAKRNGYSVVREYCGHGIGKEMHEPPQVLHFGRPGVGLTLREGMVFTIEPMLNQGGSRVHTESDGWTVKTVDGSLSAQFEHTVAVTKSGVRVLTLRPDEAAMLGYP
jgi:methionyl aminopeptidase